MAKPQRYEVLSHSPEETEQIGALLGEQAQPGDVFLLVGELGTGKTRLVQGIATGLGVQEHTRSPTFVFVCFYRGRLPLYHVDLYRVERPEEVGGLGLEEYLYGDGVTVVEWADRAIHLLPPEHLLVELDHVGETTRRLAFHPRGGRYQRLLEGPISSLAATGQAR